MSGTVVKEVTIPNIKLDYRLAVSGVDFGEPAKKSHDYILANRPYLWLGGRRGCTVPAGGIENMALTYTTQTWYALRLDWGIDGTIQNQCLELPWVGLSPILDDVLEDLPLFGCRTVH